MQFSPAEPVDYLGFSGYVAPYKYGVEKAKTDFVGRFHLTFAVEPPFLNSSASLAAVTADGKAIGFVRMPEQNVEQFLEQEIRIRVQPARRVQMKVVDEAGAAVPGANTALQLDYPLVFFAETNEAGISELTIPQTERILAAVAWKDGKGLDYRSYELSREQRRVVGAIPPEFPKNGIESLVLEGTQRFEIRVVDEDEKPVAKVNTYPWLLRKDSQPNEINLSYFRSTFGMITNEEGIARYPWVPKWQQTMMIPQVGSPIYEAPRVEYLPKIGNGRVEMRVIKKVSISGRVTLPDGKPAQRIRVSASNGGNLHEQVYTQADGRFEFFATPTSNLLVLIDDKKWGAGSFSGFAVEKNRPRELPAIVLRPATRLHGVLKDQTTGAAAGEGVYLSLVQIGRAPVKLDGQFGNEPEDNWDLGGIRHNRQVTTTTGGEYEFHVGPGFYLLGTSDQPMSELKKLEIKDEPDVAMDLQAEIRRGGRFVGKVVNQADGKPADGALVDSKSNFTVGWRTNTDGEGKYIVERNGEPYLIRAVSKGPRQLLSILSDFLNRQ